MPNALYNAVKTNKSKRSPAIRDVSDATEIGAVVMDDECNDDMTRGSKMQKSMQGRMDVSRRSLRRAVICTTRSHRLLTKETYCVSRVYLEIVVMRKTRYIVDRVSLEKVVR